MARLEALDAISNSHAEALRTKAGITSVSGLLRSGATPAGRQRLAEATGISPDLIYTWVNLADLLRVKGVGGEYLRLLQIAGVDTVVKLQRESPENLVQNLQVVNKSRHFVRRLPTVDMVADWIEQAKEMPPSVDV